MTKHHIQHKKILLVDNQPIIRQGLLSIIKDIPDLVLLPNQCDVDDLIETISKVNPDLVILDLPFSSSKSLEIIESINQKDPKVKILVFSIHHESHFGERAIRSGAMGYVNKSENIANVLNAIQQVLQGKIYMSSYLARRMFQSSYATIPVNTPSLIKSLSTREFEIFELIGKGKETKTIAGDLQLSIKTVETHRYNIKRKLMLESGNELTRYAFEYSLYQSSQTKNG